MIGTSDQSCWLAEACKILLLLHTQSLTATSGQQLVCANAVLEQQLWVGATKHQRLHSAYHVSCSLIAHVGASILVLPGR